MLQCCCRESGSASQQSGLMPTLHRDLSSGQATAPAGLDSTAAVVAHIGPLASIAPRARPPDLPILLANLRI